jgi:hypothetical protein
MRTPLHLAYGILVPEQAALTLTADCIRRSTRLQHATIPYLHSFVDPSARKDKWTVFIPVKRKLLARGCGDGECGSG